jgi:precorrin-6B methylase 2
MTPAEIEDRLFDGLARRTPGDEETTRRLARVLRLSRETRVLQVAAGAALSAPLLAHEFGARVVAVDRDAAALDRISFTARQLRVDHLVDLVHADEGAVDLDGQLFDAVICEGSLARLGGAQPFLQRFVPHVKVGGGLAFTALCRTAPLPPGCEVLGPLQSPGAILLAFPRAACEPLSAELLEPEVLLRHADALGLNAAAVLSHAAPPELEAAARAAKATAETLHRCAGALAVAAFVGRKLDDAGLSPYFNRHRSSG